MQEEINSSKSELWSLSLRDLFYKYVRFLPIFVLSVALALFVAYAYLRYATPIYSVGGTLYIKSEGQGGRQDKFEDLFVNDKALNIQSEIEVLRSKPLMQRVVDKLHLQLSYFSIGKIKSTNIYIQGPIKMLPYKIADSSRAFSLKIKFTEPNRFKVNESENDFKFGDKFANNFGEFVLVKNTASSVVGEYKIDWYPSINAAGAYASALAINPKTLGTGILSISMQTPNPALGSDIINTLMEEYATYTKEEKNKASDQTLEFIDARLVILGREIDSIQNALLVYSQNNNLINIDVQSNSYFENVSGFDKQINDQLLQLNVADMIRDYMLDKKNEFKKVVVPSSLGLPDGTLNSLVESYNTAQLERQRMIDGNVPVDHPMFKEKNGEIEQLRISTIENLANIRRSFISSIEKFQRQSATSQGQLQSLPFKAKEYNEIKRQVESKQALYKLLQEKKEETAISRAANIPNSKIIDKAAAPSVPVKPNKRAIQIMAILLGLGLPAMVIFIGEVLNDKVTTRFDIEKITPAPILGEVGHSYSDKVLIVNKTTRSMVAEQFRIIRSNLQYILNKSEKSVILVSSSFSGEGKSFISTNMAAVLALAGRKTIILEFDIRKPKVLSGLGMPKGPGITNYLVGKANLEDLVRPVEGHDNLYVMGCGPVPPNPSELLLDKKVEEMFAWMRENFDMVIVDTAPVGMVSDAMTLGKFADSTLYLVRQGHTFKKQVALIDEFYQDNKLPKVSIIINDVKMKPGYGYYGYGRYGYGYGYGYGSYYEEEHPPQTFFEKFLAIIDFRKWFKKKRK